MTSSLLRCRIIAALLAMLCGTAHATITLSTTTRAGTSATGTGTAISGRAPLPVVIDSGSGTTTTHSTGSAEQIGIRFAEKKLTTCSYTHGTLTLTCTDAFTTLSWELNTASTNGGTDWTASAGDLLAYYHDGGTELHGKPIGVRIAGSDAVEGTCGSLADGQWCWGDSDTIGSNRLYVQLTAPATDPDLEATGHVKVLYGDGEYIELQHADFNSGNPVYVYVDTKVSDDAITLIAAPTGASADETNVTVFQAVNPWTDLRYNYSVSCPNGTGGACIEDITNGDQRPGLTTTAIDETVGRGPIWAFVFKEGFGADAVITITANDDANGDTQDSQTIDVDETSWSGSVDFYVSAAGTDPGSCTSSNLSGACAVGTPCLTLNCALNQARQDDGAPRRVFLNRGDTITLTASSTAWSNETDDTLITAYGSGADPIIDVGASQSAFSSSGTSGNIRFSELNFQRSSGGATTITLNGNNCLILGTIVEGQGGNAFPPVERGTGGATSLDTVIWDCYLEQITGGASGSYALYDSSGSNTHLRRAVIGTYLKSNGNTGGVRQYVSNSIDAYNQIVHNGTAAGDNCMEIAASSFDSNYTYLYANYIPLGTNSGEAIFVFEDSTNVVDQMLVDSNFIDGGSSTASFPAMIRFNQLGTYLLVRNNVALDMKKFIFVDVGAPQFVSVFNNSFYSTETGAVQVIMDDTAPSFQTIKFINNAVQLTVDNTSTRVVQNGSSFGTLESTQILNNIYSIGASAELASVESVLYAAAADWSAASMKAAQTNTAGNPLFALPASNDFRLCTGSGVPDASCSGASPCIDAGYDLPTVYYDYSGAVRNSDDIGAWDDDSNGAGPPAAGDGANDMMLMGVAR